MLVRDVLAHLHHRRIPMVFADRDIDTVIEVLIRFPHSRLVYVVDTRNRLLGAISVGSLLRHIFPHHYEGRIHAAGMLRRLTAVTAGHLMETHNLAAGPDETVDAVLEKMACSGIKEMAVLDEDGGILADITAVDLLRHHRLRPPEEQA